MKTQGLIHTIPTGRTKWNELKKESWTKGELTLLGSLIMDAIIEDTGMAKWLAFRQSKNTLARVMQVRLHDINDITY